MLRRLLWLLLLVINLLVISVRCGIERHYYSPGIDNTPIRFVRKDSENTQILHDFTNIVGNATEVYYVNSLDQAGFYSKKVVDGNGSYVDDVKLHHAVPAWLCRFEDEEYLLKSLPREFYPGRTAVMACTILGTPAPTYWWEKWDNGTGTWSDITSLGVFESPLLRYVKSPSLGHLYIKNLTASDTGVYRCRATNQCGARCPAEPVCRGNDVIGHNITLALAAEDSEEVQHYFLNPIINHCWDTEGNYFDSAKARFCSGLQPRSYHIYSFSQYTSMNSTTSLESFMDYRRLQDDGEDMSRVGSVKWNDYSDIQNFRVLEDYHGNSGICMAEIRGFKRYNMEEYYYCTANHPYPNALLLQGMRFEFVMKEAPYIGFPRGILGKKMSKYIIAQYGSAQTLQFTINVGSSTFSQNKIKDNWICKFNGRNTVNDWHHRCLYNASNNDIAQFSLDHVVHGDAGYYQVIAGNDEGWAIGPPILLKVEGLAPEHGPYVLQLLQVATNKISVMWNQPNVVEQGRLVYEVLCENREWEGDADRRLEVAGKEWTEITALAPGVQYAITVWLHGGLVADTKLIRTNPARTEAVVAPGCSVGATVIRCEWDEPHKSLRHSEFISYNCSIWDPERNERNTTITEKREIVFGNLRPYTQYKIKVIACNELGCASSVNATSLLTEEERPGVAVFAEAPVPRQFSVIVSMLYPAILPGNIKTEVVRYEAQLFHLVQRNKDNKREEDGNSTEVTDSGEPRHMFSTPSFEIERLLPSTTYYMKFRWSTGAGDGPFSPLIKIRTGRYIEYKNIAIGCGVVLFFLIVTTVFCFYVKRRYPGLVKVVFQKIRDYINPSYMVPDSEDYSVQDHDSNIWYEFEITENTA